MNPNFLQVDRCSNSPRLPSLRSWPSLSIPPHFHHQPWSRNSSLRLLVTSLLLLGILLTVVRTQRFFSFSQTHPLILKLCFCFYILASTLSVCKSLSGCLVWPIIWNKPPELLRGKHSGERHSPQLCHKQSCSWDAQSTDSNATVAPKGGNCQHPKEMVLFANMERTPLGLPRNIWEGSLQMAEVPLSPARSKTSDMTGLHVTMMTTIPVHRLETPRSLKKHQ